MRQFRLDQVGDAGPISSRSSTPSAFAIRRCVPNTLMASGIRPAGRILEQQRRPAVAHDALHDAGHLEVRIDACAYADQVAVALEIVEECLEIAVRHRPSIPR